MSWNCSFTNLHTLSVWFRHLNNADIMNIYKYHYNNLYNIIFVVALAAFIVCPLIGLLLLLFFLQYRKDVTSFYAFFVLLALYLALINSTKIPENDQIQYKEAYQLVPERTLWQNLTGIYGLSQTATTKEMGYGVLNIVGYYLTFGSYPLFITIFSFVLYMLCFLGIYKWFHYVKVKKPEPYIISAVLVLAFFTQFFNLTIHLQRQAIATSVMVYALILSIVKDKIPWWIVIVAVTLHTSTGLFLPLFVLFHFRKRLTATKIIVLVAVFGASIVSLGALAGWLLSNMDYSIYALERLNGVGEAGRENRMSLNIVLLVSIPLSLISIKNLYQQKREEAKNEIMLYMFYLFIIVFSAFNPNNTVQYRYFMMSYAFIPYILPLWSRKFGRLERLLLALVPVFFILRFFYTFEDIVFKYAPIDVVMGGNIFTLFNFNHLH